MGLWRCLKDGVLDLELDSILAVLAARFANEDAGYLRGALLMLRDGRLADELPERASVRDWDQEQRWEAFCAQMGRRSRERSWSEQQCIVAARAAFLARGPALGSELASRDLIYDNPMARSAWEQAALQSLPIHGAPARTPRRL